MCRHGDGRGPSVACQVHRLESLNRITAMTKTSTSPARSDDEISICESQAPEFEAAWARHAGAVFDRCASLMSSRGDDVDEAFSRTSFIAYQKYAAHRGRIHEVHHWLLRLAHNVCIDLHRERARQARFC